MAWNNTPFRLSARLTNDQVEKIVDDINSKTNCGCNVVEWSNGGNAPLIEIRWEREEDLNKARKIANDAC